MHSGHFETQTDIRQRNEEFVTRENMKANKSVAVDLVTNEELHQTLY